MTAQDSPFFLVRYFPPRASYFLLLSKTKTVDFFSFFSSSTFFCRKFSVTRQLNQGSGKGGREGPFRNSKEGTLEFIREFVALEHVPEGRNTVNAKLVFPVFVVAKHIQTSNLLFGNSN